MASILIPIDLSDASLNAAVYAVNLFGPRKNSFTLLHSYLDPGMTDPMVTSMTPGLDRVATEETGTFARKLRAKLDTPDLELNTLVLAGLLPGNVHVMQEERTYDAVVMASRSTSGSFGSIFGTDVASVVTGLRIPVIMVPSRATFAGLKHVLLASDGGDLVPSSFQLLLDLARKHKAEVVVLHVEEPDTPSRAVRPDPVYHAMLGDVPHTFLNVQDADVAVAIDEEAVVNMVDLVAVLHRHLGFIEGLFHRSTTKQLALHTHIPLLVLQQ